MPVPKTFLKTQHEGKINFSLIRCLDDFGFKWILWQLKFSLTSVFVLTFLKQLLYTVHNDCILFIVCMHSNCSQFF